MHRTRPARPAAANLGRLLVVLVISMACAAHAAAAAEAPPAADQAAVLARIRDAAMSSDWAWQRLADLTDKIGPRLSGSAQLSRGHQPNGGHDALDIRAGDVAAGESSALGARRRAGGVGRLPGPAGRRDAAPAFDGARFLIGHQSQRTDRAGHRRTRLRGAQRSIRRCAREHRSVRRALRSTPGGQWLRGRCLSAGRRVPLQGAIGGRGARCGGGIGALGRRRRLPPAAHRRHDVEGQAGGDPGGRACGGGCGPGGASGRRRSRDAQAAAHAEVPGGCQQQQRHSRLARARKVRRVRDRVGTPGQLGPRRPAQRTTEWA